MAEPPQPTPTSAPADGNSSEDRAPSIRVLAHLAIQQIRSWPERVWVVALAVVLTWRSLAVPIIGFSTNDTWHYMRGADDLRGYGFIFAGYRQIGYPLFLRMSDGLAFVLGADRIFSAVLLQRLVFLVGLAAVFWALRWWSVPVLMLLTTRTLAGFTQLVVTEALSLGLLILATGLFVGAAITRPTSKRWVWRGQLVAICLVVSAMASLKLQFAAFALMPAAMLWSRRADFAGWRRSTLFAALALVPIGVLLVGQTIENKQELGAATPVGETGRAAHWSSWQRVFTNHPEAAADPNLAKYYDGGQVYRFLSAVTGSDADYETRQEIFDRRIAALYRAAGTSENEERLQSFIDGLGGGQLVDSDKFLGLSNRLDRYAYDHPFDLTHPRRAVLIEEANGGYPGVFTLGQVGALAQRPFPSHTWILGWPIWLTLVGIILEAWRSKRRWVLWLTPVAIHAAVCFSLGMYYIDLRRYLTGNVAMILIVATAAIATEWQRRQSAAASPDTDAPDTDAPDTDPSADSVPAAV